MSDWNPDKYLAFKNERTQPSIDLVERIELINPKSIIDIGCGPGNSTQILVKKYPNSAIVGLDSSQTMIEKAKTDFPNQTWVLGKAENISGDKKYSLVFSNAALQWMESHEILIPQLWNLVDEKGAFAAQIPYFEQMPVNAAIGNVMKKDRWNNREKKIIPWSRKYHGLEFYYELLIKYTPKIFLWETHYYHILPSMQGIVDFIHSTSLKPYLEQLDDENERQEFEADILAECKNYYKEQSNGNVLFPFYRIFMIAYKTADVPTGL